jgi:hypothetical protein
MNVTYWILQGLLAAVMTMAGAMTASQGKDKLSADPKMAWVEDFSDGTVRGIGLLEVAGAAGLILPWALDIAPVLTPIAAVGVAVLMAGAAITHLRRGETAATVPPLGLGAIAVVIAIGRFAGL